MKMDRGTIDTQTIGIILLLLLFLEVYLALQYSWGDRIQYAATSLFRWG